MQITYMGTEPYANLRTIDTVLRIQAGHAMFSIDCRERQERNPVHIDVVQLADGSLSDDVAHGYAYVANVDLPEATVVYNEQTGEEYFEPFKPEDFERVRVNLWTITASDDLGE